MFTSALWHAQTQCCCGFFSSSCSLSSSSSSSSSSSKSKKLRRSNRFSMSTSIRIAVVGDVVLNLAWDRGLTLAGQNALPCYDREGFMRIVETAKPRNDPDRRHFSFFTFQLPQPFAQSFSEVDYFVKCMHEMVERVRLKLGHKFKW